VQILLVEDNVMNSEFVVAVLEPEGHDITLARTGPEGLAAGLAARFDLIIMDIELPGIKGDIICQKLHAAGVRTPMIALTASAMPDQIAIFNAAGFDEVITKPVATRQLREVVRRFTSSSEENRSIRLGV
jgi:CheY-like chemotaxis protein